MVQQTHQPLVSVAITTYNQEGTIAQTLDSILAQQGDFAMEIVLGEDASSDRTRQICEEYATLYPNIIRLLPAAPNKGLLRNYRDVIRACRGKYIAECAGDDYWNGTDFLAQKVAFLETHPEYGVVHTDHDILHMDSGYLERAHRKNRGQRLHSDRPYAELMGENPSGIAALTVLIRADLMHRYVDLDHYIELGFLMEDLPTWLELSQHTMFKYMDISTATYRLAEGSACNNAHNFARNERFIRSVTEVKVYFLKKYPIAGLSEEMLWNRFYKGMTFAALQMTEKQMLRHYHKLWKAVNVKEQIQKVVLSNVLLRLLYKFYLSKTVSVF